MDVTECNRCATLWDRVCHVLSSPRLLSALCVLVFVFDVWPSHSVRWDNQLLISALMAGTVIEYLLCLGGLRPGTAAEQRNVSQQTA